jgi:trigger factor
MLSRFPHTNLRSDYILREDFQMNVQVTREGNEATLHITAPAADVNKGFKQAVAKIANEVKIPGFRKGKAPRQIIEMHYGKDSVKQEAFEIVANKAYSEAVVARKTGSCF